jgi:serine/threonine protein kinase
MAEVYLGTAADKTVAAIKVPRGDLPPSVDAEMFLREAEAASLITHSNVVRVLDWGSKPPFIAFEYIEGATLDRLIDERRTASRHLDQVELIDHISQLVDALEAINNHVVHRDVKPANVFVVGDRLKVTDFGLAKYVDEATRLKTFKGWGARRIWLPKPFKAGQQIGASISMRSASWLMSSPLSPCLLRGAATS